MGMSMWLTILIKQIQREGLNKRRGKTYINISVPDHSDRAPFISFISSQDD